MRGKWVGGWWWVGVAGGRCVRRPPPPGRADEGGTGWVDRRVLATYSCKPNMQQISIQTMLCKAPDARIERAGQPGGATRLLPRAFTNRPSANSQQWKPPKLSRAKIKFILFILTLHPPPLLRHDWLRTPGRYQAHGAGLPPEVADRRGRAHSPSGSPALLLTTIINLLH